MKKKLTPGVKVKSTVRLWWAPT